MEKSRTRTKSPRLQLPIMRRVRVVKPSPRSRSSSRNRSSSSSLPSPRPQHPQMSLTLVSLTFVSVKLSQSRHSLPLINFISSKSTLAMVRFARSVQVCASSCLLRRCRTPWSLSFATCALKSSLVKSPTVWYCAARPKTRARLSFLRRLRAPRSATS